MKTNAEKPGASAGRCPDRVVRAQGRRREIDEGVEEGLDAEVGHRAAEEDRRQLAGEKRLSLERSRRDVEQRDLLLEVRVRAFAQRFDERAIVEVGVQRGGAPGATVRALELKQAAQPAIEDAGEGRPGADRPVDGRAGDAEHALDLVEQLQRLAPETIHLVDERDDGHAAHAADLEQLDGLRLDAFDAVDEHDGGVGRGERAVGVLAEVVVAGRVEQVHAPAGVLELQHARRHRDAALPFDLHPVAGRVAAAAALLDRAGQVHRAAVEQQLLGQRRLARVGVGNDGECATPIDLGVYLLVVHDAPFRTR